MYALWNYRQLMAVDDSTHEQSVSGMSANIIVVLISNDEVSPTVITCNVVRFGFVPRVVEFT